MKRTLLAVLVLIATGAALAGEAPVNCRLRDDGTLPPSNCDFRSDIVTFNQGDPNYEIVGRLVDCSSCGAPNTDGAFTFVGEVNVVFGPYDPALCPPGDALAQAAFGGELVKPSGTPGGPSGTEAVYVPGDDTDVWFATPVADLRTDCVASTNLDFRFPAIEFTNPDGARTINAVGYRPAFQVPESVRMEENGAFPIVIELTTPFQVGQDLAFSTTRVDGPASTLRFWPEAQPFRLGPYETTFRPDRVSFTTDPALGPPPYTWVAPPASGLLPAQVATCAPATPELGDPCTDAAIHNAGYLSAAWRIGPGVASFDRSGFDLALELPVGHVTYQPLFPRGVWVRLDAPGEIRFVDGRMTDGSFSAGRAWLDSLGLESACDVRSHLRFDLNAGTLVPQLGPDGALLAGVADLQGTTTGGQPENIMWSFNEVSNLGCGTLFVPSPVSTTLPNRNWYDSAVPPVIGRGIYAGINYNRNKVCIDGQGEPTGRFCTLDFDCETGESCVDGGFSPLCPALTSTPTWKPVVENVPESFPINPNSPQTADREMVFVTRKSGVTGVFDKGDDPFVRGDGVTAFMVEYDRFGHAFLGSKASEADTIIEGGLVTNWPTDTRIPFEELKLCNCGFYDRAQTPDVLLQKNLAYWDVDFFPMNLNFSTGSKNTACDTLQGPDCDSATQSVCVQASIPMSRFEPEFVGVFGVDKTGDAGVIDPKSVSRFAFDRGVHDSIDLDPYTFDVEEFQLSDWPAAGSPAKFFVQGGFAPYGYYDAVGEFNIPFFGLTDSAVKGQFQVAAGFFRADMHEANGPLTSPVLAQRSLAGGELVLPFNVDYVEPGSTTDPADGVNTPGLGRGTLFAYAPESQLDLGPLKVAGGMILKPETGGPGQLIGGDLGPAAALRLRASVTDGAVLGSLGSVAEIDNPGFAPALAKLGATGAGHTLPDPFALQALLHDTGAIADLTAHPDWQTTYDTGASPNPTTTASEVTGAMEFSPDLQTLDRMRVNANLDTGGEFFALDGSELDYDRHVTNNGSPIAQFSRRPLGDASNSMSLQDGQNVPFPAGGGAKAVGGGVPGFDWYLDFDLTPTPKFNSLTGTLDLTKGGLSSLGFDEMNATMKFFASGDWYFDANLRVDWDGYSVNGGVLFGNTLDLSPLKAKDPDVAGFLQIDRFKGGYIGAGLSAPVFNYGCLFRVGFGVDVGGWYLSAPDDSFGGKVRGYIYGKAGCLVSVRGDLTLIGGTTNDVFKLKGSFWVGGGIGFCDPEDWNSKSDVLDDDFCIACAASCSVTGTYPPDDLDLSISGPDVDCSL